MIATAEKSIRDILDKAIAGERITVGEGLRLLESRDLAAIGSAADQVSRRMHPEPYRTYNIDRNINYTNICTAVCDFCAFYRGPKSDEGYVLPRERAAQESRRDRRAGRQPDPDAGRSASQVQTRLVRGAAARHQASVSRKSTFTASARRSCITSRRSTSLPIRDVLTRLKDAGSGQHSRRRCGNPGRSRAR